MIHRLAGLAVSIPRESLQVLCRDKSGCVLQGQVEKFSISIPRKGCMTILFQRCSLFIGSLGEENNQSCVGIFDLRSFEAQSCWVSAKC